VIIVVAAVIEANQRFLVTRRQPGVHLAGLWEFPGGKIDPDEPHADALRRELKEELDVDVAVGDPLYTTVHAYDDRTVELHFYRCALKGEPRPLMGQEMRWVPRDELGQLGFPPADAELIEMLRKSVGASPPRRPAPPALER
jgi:8-oxo-dGTP diphosphatase